ncbi:tRNA-splicing endonuclease subunit Sen2 [Hypomesus transpacificus]|uniref:tRNA-splicing endonuclease subunit Sen2 n=1 Tax=Hypomesus transpacificus TaxID=137520 RepID=UPI001F083B5B|nr:tRNA-splicing endonuclease subunit Sen2 [Hypomesus transpacificus]
MSEAVFQAPKRRARVYEAYEAPFPVLLTAEDAKLPVDLVYRAEIVNKNVIVRDPDHIQALYGKGYFGKGMLSRARPDYCISNTWEKLGDRHLPVISLSKYQQRLSWVRDGLLGQGLDLDTVSQTLQKFSREVEIVDREMTGVENGRNEGETPHSPTSEGVERAGGIDLVDTSQEAELDGHVPQAKRPRRQGDPRFDPLAELYPEEPEQVDQQVLSKVKCARHDDWIIHCGCRLEESHLKAEAQTRENSQRDYPGHEYVLVEEEDEEEEEQKKEMGERERPLRHVCRINPFTLIEYLQLSLEETFFLVYALGCLSVHYDEEPLSICQLWEMFSFIQPHFETTYMAYHYFRSKGWVPKPGVKYGSDFMLYRKGPPFYHASYSVVVERVAESFQDAPLRPFNWRSLAALSRITGNVSKELMFCYVIYPEDMTKEDLRSPECVRRVRVQEVIVSRWISSRERTEQDDI